MGNNAFSQLKKETDNIYGLIVFNKTDSLPQDVIFIPLGKSIIYDETNNLICQGLKQNNNIVPILYFQGLRWISPKLFDEINLAETDVATLSESPPYYFGNDNKVAIIKGVISFDKTRVHKLTGTEMGYHEISLGSRGTEYTFKITDDLSIIGFPVLFKGVNFFDDI
ncbi:MAG: hypothetical protein IT249_16600 [Chitinophagaceae bacterium]|nr:hypothetical protein [Chitinophagaceae bacterium]